MLLYVKFQTCWCVKLNVSATKEYSSDRVVENTPLSSVCKSNSGHNKARMEKMYTCMIHGALSGWVIPLSLFFSIRPFISSITNSLGNKMYQEEQQQKRYKSSAKKQLSHQNCNACV